MDIFQIKAFLAVSRAKNLTRAAARLHISPSALSTRIQSLEAHLQVTLFTRGARGMLPTAVAVDLLPRAERILAAVHAMEAAAVDMRAAVPRELKIGINAAPEFLQISRISQAAAKRYPQVTLHFIGSNTLNTGHMLRDDEIQLGFLFGEAIGPGITTHAITPVDVHVVVPQRYAAHIEAADWNEIAQLPWIWVETDAACHAAFQHELDRRDLSLNKVTFSLDDQITRQLVRDGQGLALMRDQEARAMAQSGHAAIWFPGKISVILGIGFRTEAASDPLINDMVDLITGLWPPKEQASG